MTPWNILLVTFPSQYLVASTFMRFQEHYESPEFRGRTFTREQFEDWYAKKKGRFSYYEDWAGFNLPASAFSPFLCGDFAWLTRKERWLIDQVRHLSKPFYVIAMKAGDEKNVFAHEMTHALYGLFPAYRDDVIRTLRGFPLGKLHRKLKKDGYNRAVFDDESNAYLATGLCQDWRLKGLEPAQRAVRAVFARHFGFRIESRRALRLLRRRVRHVHFPC